MDDAAGAPRRRPARPPIRKSLGQHFLTDRRALERIVDALGLTGAETVIEIGPGRGALTTLLAARVRRLVAVEIDRALAAELRLAFQASPHVEIVESDVLRVSLGELAGGPYALVGNVPYYITTPILFQGLARPRASRAVYLVQREVAERMTASAGAEAYGALSANVQAVATPELLFRIPPGAFHPPPKVESAVVRITPRADPVVHADEEETYRTTVQGAFGFRRKQMRRVVRSLWNLTGDAASAILRDAGIDAETRPECVAPGQFAALVRAHRARRKDTS